MPQTIYSAVFDNSAVSTATDLFHITPAANRPILIYGMTLGQTSDLGDAQEEVLRIGLYRGVTGGTGGTAVTEAAYDVPTGPTSTAQVLTLNTTASTVGTLLEVIPWNIRVPLMWFPIPELRPSISAAEGVAALRLIGAPADAITLSGTLFWAAA
jgi:hypothetical protein